MKEYSFSLAKHLQNGLRSDAREASNQPSLVSTFGVKALAPFGLVAPNPISQPINLPIDWPFPQLFRNESLTLAGTRDQIYSIAPDYTATQLPLFDAMAPGTPKTIAAPGDDWHWAGMGPNWLVTNGVSTVFKTTQNSIYSQPDQVLVFDSIPFQTACNFKRSRVLLGGLSDHFFSPTMQSVLNELLGLGVATGLNTTLTSGDNMVWFSSVGGGNVLWPIYLQMMVEGVIGVGEYGNFAPAFLDGIERNDFGWNVVGFQGKVLCILPLGESVIVYGENGICALTPTQIARTANPVHLITPFSEKSLCPFGITSRQMVGGSDDRHIFLDKNGWLWQITKDLQVSKLGFKEIFSSFQDTNVSIETGPIEDDFYIGNPSQGFILSKSGGLTETDVWPTSIREINGELVGFGLNNYTAGTTASWSFKTSTFNMNVRQVKHIANVHLDGEGFSNAYVRTWWRMSQGDAFHATGWIPFNSMGFAYPRVGGADFQLEVIGQQSGKLRLDYVNVSWQGSDYRAIRGIGETNPSSGA